MRRIEFLEIKTNDNLGAPEFWNVRFEDIDLRIHKMETDFGQIDQIAQDVLALGLSRLNDDLTPIIAEAQDRLRNTADIFSASSATAVEIGTGTKTFTIIAEHRSSFLHLQFVGAYRAGDVNEYMFGNVVSYNPTSGLLTVDVDVAEGSGTHTDWEIISSGPRGPQGPVGAPAGADVTPFTPADGIVAEFVEAAIYELKNLIDAIDGDLTTVENDLDTLEGTVTTLSGTVTTNNDAALKHSVEGQTVAGGAAVTLKDLGTWTTGTCTPDPDDRPMQKLTANGSFTLAASSVNGATILKVTNGASAGTITFSGFTDGGGDDYATTNGAVFLIFIFIAEAGGKYYQIRRLS